MGFWKSFLLIFQTWVPPHGARVLTASEKPGVMNEGFLFLEKSWNFVILLKSLGKRRNSRKDLMSFCVNATGVPYTPVAQPSWPCRVVGWWRGRGGYPSSSPPPPAPGQDRPRQGYPPPPNPLARIGVPSSPWKGPATRDLGTLPSPIDRHTPVKTLLSRRTYVRGW